MILRAVDWAFYPSAVIDYNTSNESFTKLAYVHHNLKVTHYYGCLALMNPELSGVDVRDSAHLSLDAKADIQTEMMENPWFFYREIMQVPQDGGDVRKFEINRGTFVLFWAFFNNIDVALLLIRQRGKTVAAVGLILYLLRVLEGSRTFLATKDHQLRSETISKLKSYRDHIPVYLWRHNNDVDNTESFSYNARNNKLLTVTAQNNIPAASNAGRGITAGRTLWDEVPFIRYVRAMMPAALAAGSRARVVAEETGVPYGNVFTTTPGKLDDPDGKYAYDLFHDGYFFDESLLDIPDRDSLIRQIDVNSRGDRTLIHAPFNHRQLGMTDMELYKAMANAGGTREEQQRDFGLMWTVGGLSSPLATETKEKIAASLTNPGHTEIFPNGYVIKWYCGEHELADRLRVKHIVGMDTSEAVGRDNITMVITNSETLEVLGTSIVNESNLIVYSAWAGDVLIKYPSLILVPERKSTGSAIIDGIILKLMGAGIDPMRRIFNRVVQDFDDENPMLVALTRSFTAKPESFYTPYRKYLGFQTDGPKRTLLYSECLTSGADLAGSMIKDKELISELLGLVVKNGRIDHASDKHDDCVIAFLLTVWFMMYGNRLDFYGVSNRRLMRRTRTGADGMQIDDDLLDIEEAQQRQLCDEIDVLCTNIAQNRNPFIKSNLERQLQVKLSRLKIDTSKASTITELQELIRSDRIKTRYSR